MSQAFNNSLLSIAKMLLQSRRSGVNAVASQDARLVVMGNGPSLRKVLDNDMDSLRCCDCMAVNFAANTPEFFDIRPRYYTIADPHFYRAADDANVSCLIENLGRVDWPMTIFLPSGAGDMSRRIGNRNIIVARYNAVGVEGWKWLARFAYDHELGMPRPRNVLIPSIMIGIWSGYREIYLVGADHSWTQSLSVDDNNHVITNLPHYYADNAHEQSRVKAVYADVPLHSLFLSYHIAFKAYHEIERWAKKRGVAIYNATPGSFIDAFERRGLPSGSCLNAIR